MYQTALVGRSHPVVPVQSTVVHPISQSGAPASCWRPEFFSAWHPNHPKSRYSIPTSIQSTHSIHIIPYVLVKFTPLPGTLPIMTKDGTISFPIQLIHTYPTYPHSDIHFSIPSIQHPQKHTQLEEGVHQPASSSTSQQTVRPHPRPSALASDCAGRVSRSVRQYSVQYLLR